MCETSEDSRYETLGDTGISALPIFFVILLVTTGPLKATLVYATLTQATDAALPSKSVEVVVAGK